MSSIYTKTFLHISSVATCLMLFVACEGRQPQPSSTFAPVNKPEKAVMASYYGANDGFDGKKTASGEVFNSKAYTAAHKTLPIGTIVEVTNPDNGKKVRVRINDRGPFAKGREIDLSAAAARKIGIDKEGVGRVYIKEVNNKGI